MEPITYRQFAGQWCDNCEAAYSWRPASGNCPECNIPLTPVAVTIEPASALEIKPLPIDGA